MLRSTSPFDEILRADLISLTFYLQFELIVALLQAMVYLSLWQQFNERDSIVLDHGILLKLSRCVQTEIEWGTVRRFIQKNCCAVAFPYTLCTCWTAAVLGNRVECKRKPVVNL